MMTNAQAALIAAASMATIVTSRDAKEVAADFEEWLDRRDARR